MLNGFKKFILRGNVVDMAVGVVIGAAFAGVVSALTKDLLVAALRGGHAALRSPASCPPSPKICFCHSSQ